MKLTGYLLLSLLAANTGSARGQTQPPPHRVYDIKNADGSVYIVAENHGTMPFTTLIRAKLVNMRSTELLPLRLVVMPNEKTYVLTIFKPEPTGAYTWHYKVHNMPGIQQGHLPDTSYVYRLPYYLANSAVLPIKATKKEIRLPDNQKHLYKFSLPENTPICAARAGTIVTVKQEAKKSRTANANAIYVLHSDGGYACYCNIRQHSAIGVIGQQVAVGDTLGYVGGNKADPYFWFTVHYQPDTVSTSVPVLFQVGNQVVRPR